MAKKAAPTLLQDGIPAIAELLAQHFAKIRKPVFIAQIGAGPNNGDLTRAILAAKPNFNVVILEKTPELLYDLRTAFRQDMQAPARVLIPDLPPDQSLPSFVAQHPHRRFAAAVCMDGLYALSPENRTKICIGAHNIIEIGGIFLASEPVVNISGADPAGIAAAYRQRINLTLEAPVPTLLDAAEMLKMIIGKDRFRGKDSKVIAAAPVVGATFRAIRIR